MTELLTREKELVKINTKLNELATDTMTQIQPRNTPDTVLNVGKTTTYLTCASRYDTFSKQKGPSTLLKKKANGVSGGAGDEHIIDPAVRNFNMKDRTFTRVKNLTQTKKPNHGESTKARSPEAYVMPSQARTTIPIKKLDQKMLPRSEGANTATYVKYRNPKFRESPSLEQILHEDTTNEEQLVQADIQTDTKSMVSIIANAPKKRLTADSYIKFLKAKIGILEEDHQRITQEMSEQREMLERTIETQKRFELQRDQAYNINNQLNEQMQKMEQQYEEVNRRNKEQLLESANQSKEFENIKRDVRILKQTNQALENRLGRAMEELEAARETMSQMRIAERDLKENARLENEAKEKQIKGLKRQRADLLNAYKKQLFMIDNLKRQNMCMEQTAILNMNEKEFNKILDFNTKEEN